MSHPVSPHHTTPVDSPAWDEYRESLKAAGYSVAPLPGHEDEETLHEILMSIYAVGNRLHDVLSSISASDGGNWTKTTTGQLIHQSTLSLSVAAGALDIALNMERSQK